MSEFKGIKCNINLKKEIKSTFNLDTIFSFLEQRYKLNIIIYNLELQKILGVNIEDYKKKVANIKKMEKMGKEVNIHWRKII